MHHDRLNMLKKLSFIGDDMVFFKDYIPEHYTEIYTLYTILDDASIDYLDIEFSKPIEEDNAFIFLSTFKNESDIDKFEKYLKSYDNRFKFLRNTPAYNVNLDIDSCDVKIVFSK